MLKNLAIAVAVLVAIATLVVHKTPVIPAKAVITGPDTSIINTPVFLDATNSVGKPRWFADTQFQDFNGKLFFFPTEAKSYTFHLLVTGDHGDSDYASKTVVVTGAGPLPNPVPPNPNPPLPPGKFGLAEKAKTWATGLSPSSARVVATSFDMGAASLVANGTIPDALKIIHDNNQKNLNQTEYTQWKNQFSPQFQTAMLALDNLPNSDIAIAFTEIATGLRAVR